MRRRRTAAALLPRPLALTLHMIPQTLSLQLTCLALSHRNRASAFPAMKPMIHFLRPLVLSLLVLTGFTTSTWRRKFPFPIPALNAAIRETLQKPNWTFDATGHARSDEPVRHLPEYHQPARAGSRSEFDHA